MPGERSNSVSVDRWCANGNSCVWYRRDVEAGREARPAKLRRSNTDPICSHCFDRKIDLEVKTAQESRYRMEQLYM